MKVTFIVLAACLLFGVGCATVPQATQPDKLQARVAQLTEELKTLEQALVATPEYKAFELKRKMVKERHDKLVQDEVKEEYAAFAKTKEFGEYRAKAAELEVLKRVK